MRIVALLLAALALTACAGLAQAETVQKGTLRVSFQTKISPHVLPRAATAPIAVDFGGTILTTDGSLPPQLRRITIALNRQGRLDRKGLPVCHLGQIQPSTTAKALAACGSAKVGEGSFAASVAVPGQAPFPSDGKLIAFNGVEGGRPVVFAHVYGTEPVPTSYTLPFRLTTTPGAFATTLSASLPQVTTDVGFVTGLSIDLNRRFEYRGASHSYLSASCPAPAGFPGATFTFARASFAFEDGRTLSSTMTRSCGVKETPRTRQPQHKR